MELLRSPFCRFWIDFIDIGAILSASLRSAEGTFPLGIGKILKMPFGTIRRRLKQSSLLNGLPRPHFVRSRNDKKPILTTSHKTILNRFVRQSPYKGKEQVSCAKHTVKNLFSYSPIHLFTSKKAAFTLAETLITLGIIGIVAALTITPLIQKYQEKAWLSQFKKVYNTISNAYARAYDEYGIANNWGIEEENGEEKVFNILSQYLEAVPYTPPSSRKKCFDLNNNRSNSASNRCFIGDSAYQFALKDGALVAIYRDSELKAPMLTVDTNGLKEPNTLGKDIFILYLNARNNAPVVTGQPKWWTYFSVYCTRTQSPTGMNSGGMCASWIIGTGNMDYLHRELSLEEYKKVVKNLTIPSGKDQLE